VIGHSTVVPYPFWTDIAADYLGLVLDGIDMEGTTEKCDE
jgi:hypothetical protein